VRTDWADLISSRMKFRSLMSDSLEVVREALPREKGEGESPEVLPPWVEVWRPWESSLSWVAVAEKALTAPSRVAAYERERG